jgi:hypothetical protein
VTKNENGGHENYFRLGGRHVENEHYPYKTSLTALFVEVGAI